jgi:putative nucleotidyltransferase with HDIG domain
VCRRTLVKQFCKSVVEQYDDIKEKGDFQLKVKHSSRVAKNAEKVAELNGLDVEFSYIIGLLHDIGRFEQTKRDLKFNQDHIFDHGDYGAELIENSEFIKNFTKEEAYMIIKAVKNHNKLAIEEGLDEKTNTYCKMIKDADKTDILYLVSEYEYEKDEVSQSVIDDFNRGELVRTRNVKTRQDLLIHMLSYIHDIHFEPTYDLIEESMSILKSKCIHLDKLNKF